jgi:F-type H+-transporting ATPase subunit delta
MSAQKQIQKLARQLYKMSFVEGRLSSERVEGVLQYLEKHDPRHPLAVLKAYHRLIAGEVARNQAVVEHAGEVSAQTLQTIASALARTYRRPITASSKPNPALLAGLRVRVGDDVYESSVAGHLRELGASA